MWIYIVHTWVKGLFTYQEYSDHLNSCFAFFNCSLGSQVTLSLVDCGQGVGAGVVKDRLPPLMRGSLVSV